MKESKYSPSNTTQRITFNSEDELLSQGGISTSMSYFNGIGTFNGSASKIAYSKIFLGIKSIRIKFKPSTTTQNIVKLTSSHSISASAGTLTATGFSSPTIYVNGVVSSTITTGWNDIIITTATAINIDALIIGYISSYFSGEIDLIELSKSVLAAEEVALLYTNSNNLSPDQRHNQRVKIDGGSVKTPSMTTDLIRLYKKWGIWNKVKVLWTAEAGIKGTATVSRGYNMVNPTNDLVQATAGNQPYLGGNIAPNDRLCLVNPNGGNRYMTHTPISFGANDKWTCSFMINWNGTNEAACIPLGSVTSNSGHDNFYFRASNLNKIYFMNTQSVSVEFGVDISPYIGKSTLFTFIAIGSSISLYINSIFISARSISTSFRFDKIINGHSAVQYLFSGKWFTFPIVSSDISASQILTEYNLLRSYIPEIPNVVIGSKTVATSFLDVVCNGAGTLIPDGTVTGTWVAGTSFWAYHTGGVLTGKLYNKAAREIVKTSPPSGWHVSTEAELTTLAAYGGNALKVIGSTWWANANGTNTTGLSITGASYRNADGSFGTYGATVKIWCADSDKVLTLNSGDDTAVISAVASVNDGYSILLIKD